MIRVGGGYESLEDYLLKHQEPQEEKIRAKMIEEDRSYDEIVLELLLLVKADQNVINAFCRLKKMTFNNSYVSGSNRSKKGSFLN